jgi:ATP-dependent phosphoenolpyruvate carboxykinase
MHVTLLVGPSSVGKTTFCATHFSQHEIIDTDVVWCELQQREREWNSMAKSQRLAATIRETTRRALSVSDSVVVHDDAFDFDSAFLARCTIVFAFASLRRICHNVKSRGNRPPDGVLAGIKLLMVPCTARDPHAAKVLRRDLECWRGINATKKLAVH